MLYVDETENNKMEYDIDISRHQRGRIKIHAKTREIAKEEALDIKNRDKIEWLGEEWFHIDEVTEIPLKCPNCKIELPDGSLYCNKCGTKIETL